MKVLQQLVGRGNTVAAIEHNLEVIKEADYTIDLGSEGGAALGYICAGNPWEIIRHLYLDNHCFVQKFIYSVKFIKLF